MSIPSQSSTPVPTLNIKDFTSGSAEKRENFVKALEKAYREIGFVVIKGHDISVEQQQRAYEVIGKFFSLPASEKSKYQVKGIGGARGYTSFGEEHAKDSPIGDLKEFYHVGIEVPPSHPLAREYPANVSVPIVPGFDETLRKLYDDLLLLGRQVLRALALTLKQPEDFFEEKVRYGNSILRPIHYPPLTGREEKGAVRSSAHEDINLITLLIGASSPGLQVLDRQGQWLPITTEADEIVVNVGDMLQRLSNHYFVSTTHRVVNPPVSSGGTTRFSLPFFLHPVSSMSLEALPTCVTPGNPARESPITAGDYLSERLREIGLM